MTRAPLAALLLCLIGGCATAPAADPCASYADFARQVARDRQDGFPQPYALEYYRNQVASDAGHSASVASIVQTMYGDGTPQAVYAQCKAGAFAGGKP